MHGSIQGSLSAFNCQKRAYAVVSLSESFQCLAVLRSYLRPLMPLLRPLMCYMIWCLCCRVIPTMHAYKMHLCNTAQGNEIDINSLWDQEMCNCCLCFLVMLKQKKCTHKKNRLHPLSCMIILCKLRSPCSLSIYFNLQVQRQALRVRLHYYKRSCNIIKVWGTCLNDMSCSCLATVVQRQLDSMAPQTGPRLMICDSFNEPGYEQSSRSHYISTNSCCFGRGCDFLL